MTAPIDNSIHSSSTTSYRPQEQEKGAVTRPSISSTIAERLSASREQTVSNGSGRQSLRRRARAASVPSLRRQSSTLLKFDKVDRIENPLFGKARLVTQHRLNFLRSCMDELVRDHLHLEGIYRVNSDGLLLKDTYSQHLCGKTLGEMQALNDLDAKQRGYLLAGLVKRALADLKLIPYTDLKLVLESSDSSAEAIKRVLADLHSSRRQLFRELMTHLRSVAARSTENQMDLENLGRLFAAILFEQPAEICELIPFTSKSEELMRVCFAELGPSACAT